VCVVGGGFEEGLKEDDPAEDDDLEVELAAVDDVSSALRFATGFEALEFESIPVPTTLTKRLFGHGCLVTGVWFRWLVGAAGQILQIG
jgi:hypothetical protein